MMKPGKAVHPSNGVGTAPDANTSPEGVLISFLRGSNRGNQATGQVLITNREAAAGTMLEVSFANGKDGTFFQIPPQLTIAFEVIVRNCVLRGASGGTADYSIMGIII